VEQGSTLSLDHVKPHSKGGSNHETNLVTCCIRCNSSRGDRALRPFARAVAEYVANGSTAESIVRDVTNLTTRKLAPYKLQALDLIASRGSAARAVASLS
jgi:hypothetical protein